MESVLFYGVNSSTSIRILLILFIFIRHRVFCCLVVCLVAGNVKAVDPAQTATEPAAEPWVALPSKQWPQLVLTNEAEFRGHSSLHGASAFLVQAPDGRILAATARHLLGDAGGVKPPVTIEQLAADLITWRMFPRTKPKLAITVTGLGDLVQMGKNFDWLLFSPAAATTKPPALPLRLRSTPVGIGEDVFLVSVPYSEPKQVQNVYRGHVTARGFGDRFRFTVEPPVDTRGFSGAPILDARGLVVGVMTLWFEPQMQGDKDLETGGEDSASVLKTLATKP